MDTASVFVYSRVLPFGFAFRNNDRLSLRPFNKHLESQISINNSHSQKNPKTIRVPLECSSNRFSYEIQSGLTTNVFKRPDFSHPLPSSPATRRTTFFVPLKCSHSSTMSSESQDPLSRTIKNLSFDSLKTSFFQLTPIDICKGALIFSILVAATKWTASLLCSPFFWMYFSWTWLFWPWFMAVGLAIYGAYCLRKHLCGEANVFEQLSIVTAAFTWLTLVPPAHFNGYLQGWPFVFFFVYHYFFFFNVSIRKRLYGDYYPRQHDPKWDIKTPDWYRLLFCAGVMVGHWLAAFEGPELHLIPGGWNNLLVWVGIMLTLFMQYHSTLYLANYSEKVTVPTAVVQFGPYRWVRHPIYASTMLLFVTYTAALRAPISSLFIIAVCLMYYEQKANLEEALLIETFGDMYTDYINKVRYKFIPLVY